jgi:hypothetical protein
VWEASMANEFRSLLILAFLAAPAFAATKDQARILSEPFELAQTTTPNQPLTLPGSGTTTPDTGTEPDQGAQDDTTPAPDANQNDTGNGEDISPDDMSLGEIPDVQTMELTLDIAKRAIDSYTMVKNKYADTDLEQYDNLQGFVDQNPRGKEFEADIKAAGFANVNDWNLAITTLGFAYSGVTDDPTKDIQEQIAEIQADTKVAQDMKDRMIKSLNAMIPSPNNRQVVEELMKDPAYLEKLKQLDTEEE